MKVLKEEVILNCSAKELWNILSDVSRCDWVPSVEKIWIEGDCRVFEMEGMGVIKEKIILNDDNNMRLQYSAIETATPINHHHASMCVSEIDEETCNFSWVTEIDPEIFADVIYHGMMISIEGIKKVIRN